MVTQQFYIDNPNLLLSKTQVTTLNLNNFKMAEAMGLEIIASKFPRIATPSYQISRKSTNWFKSY
jgi:hypothetical protein